MSGKMVPLRKHTMSTVALMAMVKTGSVGSFSR